MTDNPYSSPAIDIPPHTVAAIPPSVSSNSLAALAKPTFLAWERLRILFIFVPGLVTVLLAGRNIAALRTLVLIAEGAIVANICYFAGPIVETYVRWLGYEGKWVRWFLFVGGTTLTTILAAATMASTFLPDDF
ncbi:MAG: hypothetical protein R3C17_21320 [Planctomycetaceae bacterium]